MGALQGPLLYRTSLGRLARRPLKIALLCNNYYNIYSMRGGPRCATIKYGLRQSRRNEDYFKVSWWLLLLGEDVTTAMSSTMHPKREDMGEKKERERRGRDQRQRAQGTDTTKLILAL